MQVLGTQLGRGLGSAPGGNRQAPQDSPWGWRGGAALPDRKALGSAALEGCPPQAGCGKEQAVTGDDTHSTKASGAALTLYGPARRGWGGVGLGGAGLGGASHPVGPASWPDRTSRGGFSPWAGPAQRGPQVPRGHLQAETRAAPCPTGAELD